MWTLNFKSITIFCLISLVWVLGTLELIDAVQNFSSQWYWLVLALLYTTTLNDVFGHMILTHRLYEIDTSRIGYKILSFLFTVDHGWGPITSFCLVHHRHHQCSDQGNKDVANWRIHWYNMDIMSPINFIYQEKTDYGDTEKFFSMQEKKYKNILNDTWTFFIEEYSHYLTIIFWSLLFFLCPVVLFKIIFMGRMILGICTVFSSVCGHTRLPGGYRNFDTPDTSYNNLILHYLTLCVFPTILQNNHHGQKYTLERGNQRRWFEIDLSKYIARAIKLTTEKIPNT
jgi:hypothetical protein